MHPSGYYITAHTQSGPPTSALRTCTPQVLSVAFSPDGKYALCGDDYDNLTLLGVANTDIVWQKWMDGAVRDVPACCDHRAQR